MYRYLLLAILCLLISILIPLVPSVSYKEPYAIEQVVDKYPNQSLDILYQATFSPGCCPSFYTSSSGCLCKSADIHPMIMSRGGNRMTIPLPPISETIRQDIPFDSYV